MAGTSPLGPVWGGGGSGSGAKSLKYHPPNLIALPAWPVWAGLVGLSPALAGAGAGDVAPLLFTVVLGTEIWSAASAPAAHGAR